MKPQEHFTRRLLLPELNLVQVRSLTPSSTVITARKTVRGAVCSKCTTLSLVR